MIKIPRTTDYIIKEGDTGIVVWALQRVCNKMGIPTSEDGVFGEATKSSAEALQIKMRTTADGVFGPKSQRALADYLTSREEKAEGLPENILLAKVNYESGGFLGAVNWSVPGGVDCGITQRRVYDHQFDDDDAIKRAFDAIYQINLSGSRINELYGIFMARGVIRKRETGYRVAVLSHNYPYLADRISRVGFKGLSSYFTSPQSWVTVHNLKFPDGHPIRTPLDWAQRYSLGNEAHNEPGQAVKLVSW